MASTTLLDPADTDPAAAVDPDHHTDDNPTGDLDGAPTAVTFSGDPWNRWWLTLRRFNDNRTAATRLGHCPSVDGPGLVLGYVETEHTAANPVRPTVRGRVWRWAP